MCLNDNRNVPVDVRIDPSSSNENPGSDVLNQASGDSCKSVSGSSAGTPISSPPSTDKNQPAGNADPQCSPTSLSDPSASTRDISEDEIRAKEKHDADRKQCVKDRAKHSQKQKQCHDSDSDNVCTPLLIDGVELDDMGALSSENDEKLKTSLV